MSIYFENNPNLSAGELAEFFSALCPADKEELLYSHGSEQRAIDAFFACLPVSDIYAMKRNIDGRILALGGVFTGDYPCNYGVWLLCTEEAFAHPVALCRYCRKVLKESKGTFNAFVYKPNKRHILFVTRLMGFQRAGVDNGRLSLYKRSLSQCAM